MAKDPVPESDNLLTPSEVAQMFRVDPKTVTRWAKAGRLTSIRTLGGHRRYHETEVRALLNCPAESAADPLRAPARSLWPVTLTGSAKTLLGHIQGAGVDTIADLTGCDAVTLGQFGLRPAQVDHVRLVLARKGLTLRGEILGKVA
jgi:excisionase family DNA binding protein